MLGRRDNRYITASELTQVASFFCFACTGIFVISVFFGNYRKFSHVLIYFRHMLRQFFLELIEIYFSTNKLFVQSLFIIFMVVDCLMLSRIELETFCV